MVAAQETSLDARLNNDKMACLSLWTLQACRQNLPPTIFILLLPRVAEVRMSFVAPLKLLGWTIFCAVLIFSYELEWCTRKRFLVCPSDRAFIFVRVCAHALFRRNRRRNWATVIGCTNTRDSLTQFSASLMIATRQLRRSVIFFAKQGIFFLFFFHYETDICITRNIWC